MEQIPVHRLSTHGFLPHVKRLRAQQPIIHRLHEVAAEAEEILREAMEHQNPFMIGRRHALPVRNNAPVKSQINPDVKLAERVK